MKTFRLGKDTIISESVWGQSNVCITDETEADIDWFGIPNIELPKPREMTLQHVTARLSHHMIGTLKDFFERGRDSDESEDEMEEKTDFDRQREHLEEEEVVEQGEDELVDQFHQLGMEEEEEEEEIGTAFENLTVEDENSEEQSESHSEENSEESSSSSDSEGDEKKTIDSDQE